MKKNMGIVDRTIRLLVGVIIAALYFTNQISGVVAIIMGVLAVIFILSSLMAWCPLYMPIKLSTLKKFSIGNKDNQT